MGKDSRPAPLSQGIFKRKKKQADSIPLEMDNKDKID
jgi:hypothetical protein